MSRITVAKAVQETSFYGTVAFFFILAAFPFYWMVITSFPSSRDNHGEKRCPM